jgi:hypothetical protein
MYLRSVMDFNPTLLIIIIWVLIANFGGKFIKKLMTQGNGENETKQPQRPVKPDQGDVFKQIRRQLEEARKAAEGQVITPEKPVVTKSTRNYDELEKQVVYKATERTSAREKKSAEEFRQAIEKAKRREHDAESQHLEEKNRPVVTDDEIYEPYELDLRNAIIGSIIMERPYS